MNVYLLFYKYKKNTKFNKFKSPLLTIYQQQQLGLVLTN